MADSWQVRKDGRVLCASPVKNCGYNEKQLQSLKENGHSLYLNNKCVMKGRKKNGK